MEKDIRKTQLPQDSSAENIEALSRKKFEALFDEERFILKPEIIDNGVDYRAEVKLDGSKTGYGFIFQIKSKHEGKRNKDGTYSKSIDTSNIEYLLNNGQPAYYGFYVKDLDEFFFAYLLDEILRLNQSNNQWQKQKSHVIRFYKKLGSGEVDNIYNLAFRYGDMMRQVNIGRIAMQGANQTTNSLIIDDHDNVSDEREIIKMIEALGMELINNGRWSEIIAVHKNRTTYKDKPTRYNFILGIAYYYMGNYVTALNFFKGVRISELSERDGNYYTYYKACVDLGVGYITKDEFDDIEIKLRNESLLGLYLRLTKAPAIISKSNDKEGAFKLYMEEINAIIENPKTTEGLKLSCKNQAALYEGYEICNFYLQSVAHINILESVTGPNLELRKKMIVQFMEKMNTWEQQTESAKKEAWDSENWFAYHHGLITQAHVKYQFSVYADNFQISQDYPSDEVVPPVDNKPMMEAMLYQVNVAIKYFTQVEFVENVLLGVKTKYELEIYLGMTKEASGSLATLKRLSYESGNKENIAAYKYLIRTGTFEQGIRKQVSDAKEKTKKGEETMQALKKEMEKYDEIDRTKEPLKDNYFMLQFIPVGFFCFPNEDIDKILNHLHVESKGQSSIKYLTSQSMAPVLNLFYDPIPDEGYLEKNLMTSSTEEWIRALEFRRWFYENGYLRMEI